MIIMKKTKTKTILLVLSITCAFYIGAGSLFFENLTIVKDNKVNPVDFKPKSSILHDQISIDELSSNNWSDFGNKTGSGIYGDPYIIRDLEINSNYGGSGISIFNSRVYAQIINCTLIHSENIFYQGGIHLYNSTNIEIIDCNASSNPYNGIILQYSNNNSISGCTVEDNWSFGVILYDSHNNTINLNNFTGQSNLGISLKRSENNTVSNNYIHGIDTYGGMYVENSKSSHIISNNITDVEDDGIMLSGSFDSEIINNKVSDCVIGISLTNSTNCITRENSIIYSNNGLLVSNSNNNEIRGNNITNNSLSGISLTNSNFSIISVNIVRHNNENGVIFEISNNNTIFDNNIGYNLLSGLRLTSAVNNSIYDNVIYNNTYGIYISSSINTSIYKNNVGYNDDAGLYVHESDGNCIYINNVEFNNMIGISLFDSHNNSISENEASNNVNKGIFLSQSNDNEIIGNEARNNLDQISTPSITEGDGIFLSISHRNKIISNNFDDNDGSGISLFDSNKNNVSDNIATLGSVGINLYNSDFTILIGNGVYFNIFTGITIYNSLNISVIGNLVDKNDNDGIFLYRSENCTISNNNLSNHTRNGIFIQEGGNNTFIGNTIENSMEFGVHLTSTGHNTFSSNLLENCGFYVSNSNNNYIFPTNLVNNNPVLYYEFQEEILLNGLVNVAGQIILINCDRFIITNYNFTNCSIGIALTNTNHCLITNNTLSTMSNLGILLINSNRNKIKANLLYNNKKTGVSILYDSSENVIWMNNFVGNGDSQALDDGPNNHWDNGIYGNYWDDYHLLYYNVTQKVGDAWAIPYAISGTSGSDDNYPLTSGIYPDIPLLITANQAINTLNVVIQWNEVQNISKYNVYINGIFTLSTQMTSALLFLGSDGNYSITVTSESVLSESSQSAPVIITVMLLPEIPHWITEGQHISTGSLELSWNPVEGAMNYLIYIDGILNVSTSDHSTEINFDQDGEYRIYIKAVNENGYSIESDSIYILVGSISSDDDSSESWFNNPGSWLGAGGMLIAIAAIVLMMTKMKNK